jgi:aminoglycoside phosphotransferase (APT) family kinase protein
MLSQIEPLFDDELVLGLLTLEERVQLKPIAPRLRALIAELFSLPIPVALLHGDLHAGNVILRENSLLYFDWTDAAVSQPFFDMIHIFMEEEVAKRTALQEAYLLPWEENYPKVDVRRAWELAGALYGLYHAVSYQYIAHGIEELVRPELNFAFHFLRKLLDGIKRLDEN